MNKYSLPKDNARCINSKCTIKQDCKRHIDHHPPAQYWCVYFSQLEDGSCTNQIKPKKP